MLLHYIILGQTWDERVAARQAEIDSLKEALKILGNQALIMIHIIAVITMMMMIMILHLVICIITLSNDYHNKYILIPYM